MIVAHFPPEYMQCVIVVRDSWVSNMVDTFFMLIHIFVTVGDEDKILSDLNRAFRYVLSQ
jgi:hypothetical protein